MVQFFCARDWYRKKHIISYRLTQKASRSAKLHNTSGPSNVPVRPWTYRPGWQTIKQIKAIRILTGGRVQGISLHWSRLRSRLLLATPHCAFNTWKCSSMSIVHISRTLSRVRPTRLLVWKTHDVDITTLLPYCTETEWPEINYYY